MNGSEIDIDLKKKKKKKIANEMSYQHNASY